MEEKGELVDMTYLELFNRELKCPRCGNDISVCFEISKYKCKEVKRSFVYAIRILSACCVARTDIDVVCFSGNFLSVKSFFKHYVPDRIIKEVFVNTLSMSARDFRWFIEKYKEKTVRIEGPSMIDSMVDDGKGDPLDVFDRHEKFHKMIEDHGEGLIAMKWVIRNKMPVVEDDCNGN